SMETLSAKIVPSTRRFIRDLIKDFPPWQSHQGDTAGYEFPFSKLRLSQSASSKPNGLSSTLHSVLIIMVERFGTVYAGQGGCPLAPGLPVRANVAHISLMFFAALKRSGSSPMSGGPGKFLGGSSFTLSNLYQISVAWAAPSRCVVPGTIMFDS